MCIIIIIVMIAIFHVVAIIITLKQKYIVVVISLSARRCQSMYAICGKAFITLPSSLPS